MEKKKWGDRRDAKWLRDLPSACQNVGIVASLYAHADDAESNLFHLQFPPIPAHGGEDIILLYRALGKISIPGRFFICNYSFISYN